MELITSKVAAFLFGKTTESKDAKFKDNWSKLNHSEFDTPEFDSECLKLLKIEVAQNLETIKFKNKLMRDDYKQVLQLVSTVLGLPSAKLYKLKKPGAFHHARWMAKILYFLKIFMFGIQMKYPEPVMQLLKRISTLLL